MSRAVFQGGLRDRYSGYVFNHEREDYTVRFRNYNPELGRWMQRDPIGYFGGVNLYGYTYSSPASYSDPSGLSPILNSLKKHKDRVCETIADRINQLRDQVVAITNALIGGGDPYIGTQDFLDNLDKAGVALFAGSTIVEGQNYLVISAARAAGRFGGGGIPDNIHIFHNGIKLKRLFLNYAGAVGDVASMAEGALSWLNGDEDGARDFWFAYASAALGAGAATWWSGPVGFGVSVIVGAGAGPASDAVADHVSGAKGIAQSHDFERRKNLKRLRRNHQSRSDKIADLEALAEELGCCE